MYRNYRIVESIASSVSQYESYRDQVYRYTPSVISSKGIERNVIHRLCELFKKWNSWLAVEVEDIHTGFKNSKVLNDLDHKI